MILNKPSAELKEKEINVPYVKTMMLLSQTVNAQISSQGFIKPKSELNIISQLNARVEWLSKKMEEGSSFSQGDTLIKLDQRDYELALITAEANVLNAEVNLERERAESDLATKEWGRVGDGSGSALALRKPQLAQAKATLEAARASLERARRIWTERYLLRLLMEEFESEVLILDQQHFQGHLLPAYMLLKNLRFSCP